MRDVNEPRWVRVLALVSALALASFGAVGLLLADLGIYKPYLALIIGLVALVFLYRRARRLLDVEGEVTTAQRVCAQLAVALSAGAAIWHASNASEHAQINRDGGIYLNAGRWIATHGTLNLEPYAGPFAGPFLGNPLSAASPGMKQHGLHLEFQISHMLSAVFALARNLGGDRLMFMTVPILSGFALLAFYLLANRLLAHPVAALGATATLAVLMPQISFSRDSTTEIPIQVLLFTALWLLCDRRALRAPGPAFAAGLLLGLVQAIHVDGLAFLVGVPAVYAVTWLNTPRARRSRLKRGFIWSAAGIGTGALLGALDLFLWDREYISVIGHNVAKLGVVEILGIAAGIVAVVLLQKPKVFDTVKRIRPPAAWIAGGLTLVVGFGLWFVRPHLQTVHAARNPIVELVQQRNGLPIDGTKRWFEHSVEWISWYVGPITLTLAIIGAAGLAIALVRGSLRLPVQIATFMLAPPALLYIWTPSITPDHVWAARRFLPAVFPAVILLAFGALCMLARAPDLRWPTLRRSTAIVLGIAAVIYPAWTIRDVTQMTEQRGLFPVITKACDIIGDDGAVVILKESRSIVWLSDPQTFRSFCNVPVTIMNGPPKPDLLHKLAARWKREGRRLFVVAAFPSTIQRAFPNADVRLTGGRVNPHFLEQTLTRRPDKYAEPETLHLALATVVPIAAFENPTASTASTTSTSTPARRDPAG